jgi:hypothetical protein
MCYQWRPDRRAVATRYERIAFIRTYLGTFARPPTSVLVARVKPVTDPLTFIR